MEGCWRIEWCWVLANIIVLGPWLKGAACPLETANRRPRGSRGRGGLFGRRVRGEAGRIKCPPNSSGGCYRVTSTPAFTDITGQYLSLICAMMCPRFLPEHSPVGCRCLDLPLRDAIDPLAATHPSPICTMSTRLYLGHDISTIAQPQPSLFVNSPSSRPLWSIVPLRPVTP